MKFSKFADYLKRLDETTKRLEITEILKNLISEVTVEESKNTINLALGQLEAPFEAVRFNIAEKMMIRTLAQTYSKAEDEIASLFKRTGDLGDVAEEMGNKEISSDLEINEVHKKLLEIANYEGTGSQDKKINELSTLLSKLSPLSAKYVTRIVLGTTRLGFTAPTIVDALSNLVAGDKSLKDLIESRYNVYPDIALITQKIKQGGLEEVQKISMQAGVPLMPQKPQRLATTKETLDKMGGRVMAEFKFDGTRVQLHMDKSKVEQEKGADLFGESDNKYFVKTFTRNLDDSTHQFPDIIAAATKYIDAESIILDGEAIAYDKKTGEFLPFQETIQRKRKHGVKDMAEQIPLQYLVFDILYLNGKEVYSEPYEERRELLNDVIKENETIKVDQHLDTEDPQELEDYFFTAKEKKLEGLVVKNPNDAYQAGARSFSWVKLKRIEKDNESKGMLDSIDVVILGYYNGRGARAKFGIGGILAGVFDKETNTFKSVTKVGSGFTDEGWENLKKKLDKIKIDKQPANVDVLKDMHPDTWVSPEIVVEVLADEISNSKLHTAEYALRFPRFISYRADKLPEDSTSLQELVQLI